jgi:hypothetical protein
VGRSAALEKVATMALELARMEGEKKLTVLPLRWGATVMAWAWSSRVTTGR